MKPILISLSPNTDSSDLLEAFKLIVTPWRWLKGQAQQKLKSWLANYFSIKDVFLLDSARSGLFLSLKALGVKSGDQVICQAFTCVAVPNSILWTGAKPIFVDVVRRGFNLNINDLKKKITRKTKAVIIQHTFGIPDNIDEIKKICQKHNLALVEDCAQSLGARYKGKLVGTFGDITVVSFGRDKVVSSIWGGAVLTSNPKLAKKLIKLTKSLKYPDKNWIFKQLLHPLLLALVVPTYYLFPFGKFTLGKALMFLFQKLGVISFPVDTCEKQGDKPDSLPALFPNSLARLALIQLSRLTKFNSNRQQIAQAYLKNLSSDFLPKKLNYPSLPIYLRFPILVDNPEKLIKFAGQNQIMLGDWYRPIISPKSTNLAKIGYQADDCPNAQNSSQKVVNLPTHPKMNLVDAQRILKLW